MRNLNKIDKIISEIDKTVKTIFIPQQRFAKRNILSELNSQDNELTQKEKKHIAGLMRINHTGEVCAQALYQGQAITAKSSYTKKHMETAAYEEIEHLAWCEQRLNELNGKPSLFNLFWYSGSFVIGALAGAISDSLSMGFIAETEIQVSTHLENHIKNLPKKDKRTICIKAVDVFGFESVVIKEI